MKYNTKNFNLFLKRHTIIKDWFTSEELKKIVDEYGESSRFNDSLWGLFNQALIKNAKFLKIGEEHRFYKNSRDLYFDMSLFRLYEGTDRKAINKFKRLHLEAALEEEKINVRERSKKGFVHYISVMGSCYYSDKFADKELDPDNFFEKYRLASDECDSERECRCYIYTKLKRDREGRRVRIK